MFGNMVDDHLRQDGPHGHEAMMIPCIVLRVYIYTISLNFNVSC